LLVVGRVWDLQFKPTISKITIKINTISIKEEWKERALKAEIQLEEMNKNLSEKKILL